eukprot:COSAG04_NODE_827_length_10036_cov_6.659455_5_plen_599_part_00
MTTSKCLSISNQKRCCWQDQAHVSTGAGPAEASRRLQESDPCGASPCQNGGQCTPSGGDMGGGHRRLQHYSCTCVAASPTAFSVPCVFLGNIFHRLVCFRAGIHRPGLCRCAVVFRPASPHPSAERRMLQRARRGLQLRPPGLLQRRLRSRVASLLRGLRRGARAGRVSVRRRVLSTGLFSAPECLSPQEILTNALTVHRVALCRVAASGSAPTTISFLNLLRVSSHAPVGSGPLPTFSISSGPCTVSADGLCLRTPGYPEVYSGPGTHCSASVSGPGAGVVFDEDGKPDFEADTPQEVWAEVPIGGDHSAPPFEFCFVPAATCDEGASPSDCTMQCEVVHNDEVVHFESDAPEGTACDDGDPLTKDDSCDDRGVCAGVECASDAECVASSACKVAGMCQDGRCTAETDAADGTACNDDNALTKDDSCSGGTCSGVPLCDGVTCPAESGPCRVAGTCQESDGQCLAETNAADGIACDDDNTGTINDICTGGVCAGAAGMSDLISSPRMQEGFSLPSTGGRSVPSQPVPERWPVHAQRRSDGIWSPPAPAVHLCLCGGKSNGFSFAKPLLRLVCTRRGSLVTTAPISTRAQTCKPAPKR